MIRFNKILAIILCIAITLSLLPLSTLATQLEYIEFEPFDGVATNGTSDKLTITGAKARTVIISDRNKALELLAGDAATATFPYHTDAKRYVISFDIGLVGRVKTKITLNSGKTENDLLSLTNIGITTKEGKRVSATNMRSNGFTRIAIAIDRKIGYYTLYVNGKAVLRDWKLPSTSKFDSFSIKGETKTTESIYFDNLIVYEGTDIMNGNLGGSYSEDGVEFVDINDDIGDFSFFKSEYITHRYVGYPNTTFTAKGNEIVCEKFDYTNADKGDRIIFKKTNESDLYMDIKAHIFSNYGSSKVYKHFKMSGDFMMNFEGDSSANLFFMRDSITTGSANDFQPMRVQADGSILFDGGKVFHGIATKGKWFNVTMYVDCEKQVMNVFLDGELVLKDQKIKNGMENLSMVRVQVRSGAFTGEMQCRNMEFTGLDKAYNGEEIYTSMYPSDEPIEDYLADKICFHYDAENMWYNKAKAPLSAKPVYENGELYVSEADFNTAYGIDATFDGNKAILGDKEITLDHTPNQQDGVVLVPVMETAQKLLGYYAFDDTNGFIITSKDKIYFDASKETPYHLRPYSSGVVDKLSTLQYIYDYMLFDRPDKEYLLETFNKVTDNGSQHPRILANADDFARIRDQYKTDDYMKMVVDDLIAQADLHCDQEPIFYKYNDNLRTLNTANKLRERMLLIGFAYQITGEQKYADCAWKNLDALNGFPDFNGGHPIDTGSYGTGVAIGYDWFYDTFTPEQRENIQMNAERLHLTLLRDSYYGRSPVRGGNDGNTNLMGYQNKWIGNYNAWVNGGAVLMAIAFMDTYPDLCSDLLANCIRGFEYPLKALYPDGSWQESLAYWQVVANAMALIFPSLEMIYDTDFNLSRFPGTEETGITNMSLRGMYTTYNYHDADPDNCYADYTMPFLAEYFNHPELLAARKGTLNRSYDSRMKKQSAHVYDALFYDPEVTPEQINDLPNVVTAEGLELFAVHEDWSDYEGFFFASHGGPVRWNHSHYDAGDFFFIMDGETWGYSTPKEYYNASAANNEKYRVRTEGHNVLTINNNSSCGQVDGGYAKMIATDEGSDGAYVVYDMSDTYADVSHYKRGFYIDDNYRTITVRDELELTKDNSEIYWFMHTKANGVVIDDHTALLSYHGKSFAVNFETDAEDYKLEIMDALPLPSSPQADGQRSTDGIRKVAIRLVASGKVNLTVRLSELPGMVDTTPIDNWTAPETTDSLADNANYGYNIIMNNHKFENLSFIPVLDKGVLPEFDVEPVDPTMHIEIKKSDDMEDANIIKVYNADRTNYQMYIVLYSTMYGVMDIAYDEVEIVDHRVSSTEPNSSNVSKNMFDSDFNTRWTTMNIGEYAIFDFGSSKQVDGVATAYWLSDKGNGEYLYKFDMYYSNDGVNWKYINSYTTETAEQRYQIFKFDQTVDARYLKLVGQGNTTNVNTNMLEFRALRLKEAFR